MRHSDSSAERIAPLPSLSNYRTVEQAYTEHALIDSRTMSIVEGSLLHASVPDFASACKSSFSVSFENISTSPSKKHPSIHKHGQFLSRGSAILFQTCNSNLKSRFTIPTVFDQISKTSSFHILEEVEGLIEQIYGTASRKERRRGSNNLEAIAGIKRVTRSRPIGFDAFNFPSLNQRCAKGMRGPCLLERKERRKKGGRQKKDEADKRRYRESNILDLSRVQNVAERFRGPSPLISHRIRGISKFPQEWTLGEI